MLLSKPSLEDKLFVGCLFGEGDADSMFDSTSDTASFKLDSVSLLLLSSDGS